MNESLYNMQIIESSLPPHCNEEETNAHACMLCKTAVEPRNVTIWLIGLGYNHLRSIHKEILFGEIMWVEKLVKCGE